MKKKDNLVKFDKSISNQNENDHFEDVLDMVQKIFMKNLRS